MVVVVIYTIDCLFLPVSCRRQGRINQGCSQFKLYAVSGQPMKYLIFFNCLLLSSWCFAENYPVADRLCDGYPQAKVGTAENICVGVVAQGRKAYGWNKPRRILQVPGKSQFLITDMGGWQRGRGKLWLLDTAKKPATVTALLSGLKLPHGLELGPKGQFYVGESNRIFRFRLRNNKAIGVQTVVSNLPDWNDHRHPLTHFIFDQDSNLIVNVGAPSDDCKADARAVFCTQVNDTPETNAAVRRYPYIAANNSWSSAFEVIARGLRNSMALSSHSSGVLLQAENSVDLPGDEQPFEEINLLEDGGFYGWPYCYDNDQISSLWPTHGGKICADKRAHKRPWVLMPAHAAPLDMRYYTGDMFDELKNSLLVSWHGYRDTGHRLVSYPVDGFGLPKRSAQAYYFIDNNHRGRNPPFTRRAYPPTANIAQAQEVISQMNAVAGVRPMGRPVGITVADDGAIWMVDDVNQAILRIARGAPYNVPALDEPDTGGSATVAVSDSAAAEVFLTRCQGCHGLPATVETMRLPEHWLVKEGEVRVMEQRLFHDTVRPMPPDAPLTTEQVQKIRNWVNTL